MWRWTRLGWGYASFIVFSGMSCKLCASFRCTTLFHKHCSSFFVFVSLLFFPCPYPWQKKSSFCCIAFCHIHSSPSVTSLTAFFFHHILHKGSPCYGSSLCLCLFQIICHFIILNSCFVPSASLDIQCDSHGFNTFHLLVAFH